MESVVVTKSSSKHARTPEEKEKRKQRDQERRRIDKAEKIVLDSALVNDIQKAVIAMGCLPATLPPLVETAPPEVIEQSLAADALLDQVHKEMNGHVALVEAVVNTPKADDSDLHIFDSGKGDWTGTCRVPGCGKAYRSSPQHVKGKRVSVEVERPRPTPRQRTVHEPSKQRAMQASERWHEGYAALPAQPVVRSIIEQRTQNAFVLNVAVLNGEGPVVPLSLHAAERLHRELGAILVKHPAQRS